LGATPGKPHTVDDSLIRRQTKDTRFGIAGLRTRGDGAHLDVAETERRQATPAQAILIIAGGEPHGVGKAQAEGIHRQWRGRKDTAQQRGGGRQSARQPHQ